MRATFVLRVRILCGVFIFAAIILVVRLYFVQIVHGKDYRNLAAGQYVERGSESEARGDILFTERDGAEVAAAVMQNGWRIAIQPADIKDAEATYKVLSDITPIDRQKFLASAAKKDDPYEEVAFRLTDEAAHAVDTKKISGVITVHDEWRMYPANNLASHVIGFVGYQGDIKKGVYGLEKYYEDTLSRSGDGIYVNPFAEIFTNVAAALSSFPASHEGSIITSIEPAAQDQLEKSLAKVMKDYDPNQAGGIVMDPKTGEVIAMAVKPDFDPNTYNTTGSNAVFSNPIVQSTYEMGSIMKPLTLSAAINEGVITPATTYNDKGCIEKTGKRVCNFDGKGRGVVSMQEVLNQSLNTGASFAVDRMGQGTFAGYMAKYGFGEETGIDLPSEVPGNISSITQRGAADVDFASASFGQGVAVTPIEMIRALGILANGGALPEPHVGKAVRYQSGIVRNLTQAPVQQVLKPETVDTVTTMLVTVFDKALLGGVLKQEHYSIAAKTGTAQIAKTQCKGYCEGVFLHSFFGYFPAHDPKFIILLYAVEPKKEQYASHTLAYPFMDITKFLINYYNLAPDR